MYHIITYHNVCSYIKLMVAIIEKLHRGGIIMKGQVASMVDTKAVEIKEFDLPKMGKGQILMRVLKSNICGSDIHMWEGKHLFKNHVLGHEMVGVIEELGEG